MRISEAVSTSPLVVLGLSFSLVMAEPIRVSPKDLNEDNRFKPPHDEIFDTLFGLAIQDDLKVYFAAIPIGLIKPFSDKFKIAANPRGQQLIDSIISDAARGSFRYIWVYERGGIYVMSDDYLIYEAFLQMKSDYVPCWTFGKPRNPLVTKLQGPVDARKAAGFSDQLP